MYCSNTVASLQVCVCVWYSLNCFGCVYLWLITCIRLPAGPLGTSCLCSCHSTSLEKAHITLLPQWQDRIKRSPVPGERKWNPRADLLRRCSETPQKCLPSAERQHFLKINSQVTASYCVSASRHDVNVISINPYLVTGFHNIYTTQLYVICTEVRQRESWVSKRCGDDEMLLWYNKFQGALRLIFCPWTPSKPKICETHRDPGKEDKCQCEEFISVGFPNSYSLEPW